MILILTVYVRKLKSRAFSILPKDLVQLSAILKSTSKSQWGKVFARYAIAAMKILKFQQSMA